MGILKIGKEASKWKVTDDLQSDEYIIQHSLLVSDICHRANELLRSIKNLKRSDYLIPVF